jgi:hypothetical protein
MKTFLAPRHLATEMRNAFGIFVADKSEDVEVVFSSAVAWRIEERMHQSRGNEGKAF